MSLQPKHYRRRLWLISALAATLTAGCIPGDSSQKSKSSGKQNVVNAKDRPALQVVLVDAGFDQELSFQWQSFSEQPIQIKKINSSEIHGLAIDATDVWVFPANLMGDMVATERIVPLTTAAAGLPFADGEDAEPESTGSVSDSPISTAAKPKSTMDAWPSRWRAASRFGNVNYALPLGASQLVLVGRDIKTDKLDLLDDASTPQENRTALAAEAWKEFFAGLPAPAIENSDLEAAIHGLNHAQESALVDRFLFVASTTNAKRRGLFDMTKLQPRLATEEFLLAAEVLGKLVRSSPASMLATHSDAFALTTTSLDEHGTCRFAIAMPGLASMRADEAGGKSTDANANVRSSNLTLNPFQGLVVSIGRKTRQTSVASQFIAWLSTSAQRDALSRLSNDVELWPAQPNPLLTSETLRNYYNINNREHRLESALLSIRFAQSQKYREALGKALKASILSPDQIQEHLENCVHEWNAITESLGTLNQRKNVEQAMGFGS